MTEVVTPPELEVPGWMRAYVELLEFVYVGFLSLLYANCVVSVVLAVYADARGVYAAAAERRRQETEVAVTVVRRPTRDALMAHLCCSLRAPQCFCS